MASTRLQKHLAPWPPADPRSTESPEEAIAAISAVNREHERHTLPWDAALEQAVAGLGNAASRASRAVTPSTGWSVDAKSGRLASGEGRRHGRPR